MRKHRPVSADTGLSLQNPDRWNWDHVAALNSLGYRVPRLQSSRELQV